MPSATVDFKYSMGTPLYEGERQAAYETEWEGRPAVLKFTRPETTFDSARLVARYSAASKLRHPNLVRLFDFGEAEVFDTHVVFVVMERADGSLASAMQDDATLSEEDKMHLRTQLRGALQFLHANGYAHGSVRPSNILAFGETAKLSADNVHVGSKEEYREDLDALSSVAGTETEPASAVPVYRRHAKLAVGGAIAAALLCFFLIWNAQRKPSTPDQPPPAPVESSVDAAPAAAPQANPAPPAIASRQNVASPDQTSPAELHGWTVVGAAYKSPDAAAKRASSLNAKHPALHARAALASGGRHMVVFATGLTEAEAKTQLRHFRSAGAPRDSYISRF